MKNSLKRLLTHPLVRNVNIDTPEAISCVSKVIQNKIFLKQIYKQWYVEISKLIPVNIGGPVLELGSGAGFLEKYIQNMIKSEILIVPGVDIVLDAHHLPFNKGELLGIVMVDVLHHLSNVESFFQEAIYSVKKGGVIVMIEPWVTWWSRLIYRNLHHEPFDDMAQKWTFPKGGPLSQANSALPWIIFHRDKQVFNKKFPDWEIQQVSLHTPFSYLLSGGVSMRSFLPKFTFRFCRLLESAINPWMESWAMFVTVALRRL